MNSVNPTFTDVAYGFHYPNPQINALFDAIEKGDLKVVQSLMRFPQDLELRDMVGNTPMHHASWHGQLDVVKFLLNNRAKVNVEGMRKCTPLMLAAENNHADVCKVLLSNVANVDAVDESGFCALHYAAGNSLDSNEDRRKTYAVLLNHGANVNTLDRLSEVTPLFLAVYNNQLNVQALFRAFGHQVDLDLTEIYDDFKDLHRPKILEVHPFNRLQELYISQKMVTLQLGVRCSYKNRRDRLVPLVGATFKIALGSVLESVNDVNFPKKEHHLKILQQTFEHITATLKKTITPYFISAHSSDLQAFLICYKLTGQDVLHAVGLAFSRSKKLLLKLDRGDTPELGMSLFTIGRVDRLDAAVYFFSKNPHAEECGTFFKKKINEFLELKLVKTVEHRCQKIGKCTDATSKLLLRAVDFLDRVDVKDLRTAEIESRKVYKVVTKHHKEKAFNTLLRTIKEVEEFARENGFSEKELEHFGIVPRKVLSAYFFQCLKDKHLERMLFLLDRFPEFLNQREQDCWRSTPLIKAAFEQQPKTFMALLRRGADVEACIMENINAIHVCINKVMQQVIPRLLKIKPGLVNAQETENGNAPWHLARIRELPELEQILWRAGADNTIRNRWGKTPLDYPE